MGKGNVMLGRAIEALSKIKALMRADRSHDRKEYQFLHEPIMPIPNLSPNSDAIPMDSCTDGTLNHQPQNWSVTEWDTYILGVQVERPGYDYRSYPRFDNKMSEEEILVYIDELLDKGKLDDEEAIDILRTYKRSRGMTDGLVVELINRHDKNVAIERLIRVMQEIIRKGTDPS